MSRLKFYVPLAINLTYFHNFSKAAQTEYKPLTILMWEHDMKNLVEGIIKISHTGGFKGFETLTETSEPFKISSPDEAAGISESITI